MTSKSVFFEVPCLTESSSLISGRELQKKLFKKAGKVGVGELLQKFIAYNQRSFDFLEVTPSIVGTDQRASIVFRTSRFIGAVPLRAPDNGKQIGDFVVIPRFVGRNRFEDYIEILDLLGSEISPEVGDSLPLASGRNFRPPFYLEAVKFVVSLEKLLRQQWRKFDCVETVRSEPLGQINWKKYIQLENKPENRLRFPVRKNVLSEFHREYGEIRYAFDVCHKELTSPATPQRIRTTFYSRLSFIEKRLYLHKPLAVEAIKVKTSDSPSVKECKTQANRVLRRDIVESTAWRVDFNDVFEKFVQHVFRELARSVGGNLLANPRIRSQGSKFFSWELRQLEPDAIFRTDELVVFVDAKYKSHLYNKYENSDLLKDDFRRDLHQILAYTSFGGTSRKLAVICYPSNEVEIKATQFRSALNDASTRVVIIGIPLRRSVISNAVRQISVDIDEFKRVDL